MAVHTRPDGTTYWRWEHADDEVLAAGEYHSHCYWCGRCIRGPALAQRITGLDGAPHPICDLCVDDPYRAEQRRRDLENVEYRYLAAVSYGEEEDA
jgi:hypothetical protein